jgi:hypothetical protein
LGRQPWHFQENGCARSRATSYGSSRCPPTYLRSPCTGSRHGCAQSENCFGCGGVMTVAAQNISHPLILSEVASLLRKSPRWLRDWLRANPKDANGEPYFTPVGRDKIFHQTDIARIERDLRGGLPQCRSSSGRRASAKPQTTKYEAPTSGSEWKLAAELTNDPSLIGNSAKSKSASSSTGDIPRPNLSLVQGSRPS